MDTLSGNTPNNSTMLSINWSWLSPRSCSGLIVLEGEIRRLEELSVRKRLGLEEVSENTFTNTTDNKAYSSEYSSAEVS